MLCFDYLLTNSGKKISLLGSAASLILAIFLYTMDKIQYSLACILALCSFLIWLQIRKDIILISDKKSSYTIKILLCILFNLIFILSLLSFYFRPFIYKRPILYFVLVSFLIIVLYFGIMISQKKEISLILFGIILVGLFLSYSQSLTYPSLIGSDPWYHQELTLKIINSHSLDQPGYVYSKLPIFHLYIIATSLLTGLNYKFSTMLSASLMQIICNSLFVFLLSTFIFKYYKIGLLASLLLITSNEHIFMSYWSIPNAFAAIYIFPIFYLIFKINQKNSVIATTISIIMMVCIVLTHSLAALFFSLIIFAFWASSHLYSKYSTSKYIITSKPLLGVNFLILFNVLMYSWWTYASSGYLHLMGQVLSWGFKVDFFVSTPKDVMVKYVVGKGNLDIILDNIGMLLFFSLSIIGLLYMISSNKRDNYTFSIALMAIIPLIAGFSTAIIGPHGTEDRWWFFSEFLLTIPASIAVLILHNKVQKKVYRNFFFTSFLMLLFFTMIVSPQANADNRFLSPSTSGRVAPFQSELQAIKTIDSISNNPLKVDNMYSRGISPKYGFSVINDDIFHENFQNLDGYFVLIRKEMLGNAFLAYSSFCSLDYNILQKLDNHRFSKIYDCDTVYGLIKTKVN